MSKHAQKEWPLVAVVTPVFNGALYLEATMRCVQQQTYDNIVHVIVDNCSTDRTPEIIEAFRAQRIPLIVRRNELTVPLKENWTLALQAAPSEASFIKILCADDLMRSDCIARFVELAESDEHLRIVLCQDVFGDMVHRAKLPTDEAVFDGVTTAGMMLDESINWLPYHHLFVRYDEETSIEEFFSDTHLHFDLTAVIRSVLGGKFGYIHEPLVYTRWHDQSLTSTQLGANQLKTLLERFDILETFGSRCWDEDTFYVQKTRLRYRLLRLAMKWAAMGKWDAALALKDALDLRHEGPGLIDWAMSVITWLPYVRWKNRWRLPTGPRIEESAFLCG